MIKGSEEALKSPKGILPRDTYLSLFGKMEIIYDLFERYQKMKSLEEDFDDADSWDGGYKRKEKEASGQRAAECKQTRDGAGLDSKGKDAEAVVEVVCESRAKGDGEKLQTPSEPDVIDCQPLPKPIMSSMSSR